MFGEDFYMQGVFFFFYISDYDMFVYMVKCNFRKGIIFLEYKFVKMVVIFIKYVNIRIVFVYYYDMVIISSGNVFCIF